jgi:hypothetical protein
MNVKGIVVYLVVTFGVAFGLVGVVSATGILSKEGTGMAHLILYYALMAVPALGVIAAAKASGEPVPRFPLFSPPRRVIVGAVVGSLALFALAYGVSALAGWVSFDAELRQLKPFIRSGEVQLPVGLIVGAAYAITILLGPTLYAILSLGTVYGWHGYLARQLTSFGRVPSYLVIGLLWGLWFAPLVFSGYGSVDSPVDLLIRVCLLCVALSVVLGEVWRRSHHLGALAVVLGCFVTHAAGAWDFVFPSVTSSMGGGYGYLNIILWSVAAVALLIAPAKELEVGEN